MSKAEAFYLCFGDSQADDTDETVWNVCWPKVKLGISWADSNLFVLQRISTLVFNWTSHFKGWGPGLDLQTSAVQEKQNVNCVCAIVNFLVATLKKKKKKSPGPVAQLVGVSSHAPKGCGFNSRSGHIPRVWVWSLVGAHSGGSQACFSLCLSLLLSLKAINISLGEDLKKLF